MSSDESGASRLSSVSGVLRSSGSKVARVLMRPSQSGLLESGIGWPVVLRALVLTCLTYCVFNAWSTRAVDRAYRHAQFAELEGARTTSEGLEHLLGTIGADPALQNEAYIRDAFREGGSATCRTQILNVINGMQNKPPEGLERTLDDHMTGQRRGWPWFVVRAAPVSGAALVRELRTLEWDHKNAVTEEAGGDTSESDADAFLIQLIDRTAAENRSQLRGLMRLNGTIQWITIASCWLVVVVCVERFLKVRQVAPESTSIALPEWIRRVWPVGEVVNDIEPDKISDELLDRRVYNSYEFLIGLLPTLGFIGTVMGMGDALLSADGLFSAQDKGSALGAITSHLGFAFDTTLVGLVTGIIAASCAVSLRRWESRVWDVAGSADAENNGQPSASPSPAADHELIEESR